MTSTASPFIRRVYMYMKTRRFQPKGNKYGYLHPYYPSTGYKKLMPALSPDVQVKRNPVNLQGKFTVGIDGRLFLLAARVTRLVKLERLEFEYHQAVEIRGYMERLLIEAIRHGDCHNPTMDLVQFWIREPQLVHKLFKVLVPRYQNYTTSFTSLYKLAPQYHLSVEGKDHTAPFRERGVIELKGNPFPPLKAPPPNNKYLLTNILLDAARSDYEKSQSQISSNQEE